MASLNQAGILPVQNYPTLQLNGNGVLIGFMDSGIDYRSGLFRRLDGSTRIEAIWDQTIQSGTPPEAFAYGSEYTRDMIDEALRLEDPLSLVPSVDETGHGTYAVSLAAEEQTHSSSSSALRLRHPSLLLSSSRQKNISGTTISFPKMSSAIRRLI